MEKNYSYWDEIDAACEELVDFMIQQSDNRKVSRSRDK